MDGIIIFADDDVLTPGRFENDLYEKLKSETKSPVLPIRDLETLEDAVKSVSKFRLLILDWKFKRNIDHQELQGSNPPDSIKAMDFLRRTSIYSFIHIYSENELHEQEKDELKELFPGKINFKRKNIANVDGDIKEIIKNVEDFENKNKHMKVPFKWGQAVNQSVQKILTELEQASRQWTKEIYDTAKDGGSDPASEVIDTFGHLLNEALIQDNGLREFLRENAGASEDNTGKQDANREENAARLYRRIYYSKYHDVTEGTPIMTGDIFKFEGGEYGILITPECKISEREQLEVLLFSEESFRKYVMDSIVKEGDLKNLGKKKKKEFTESFNNKEIAAHILPSFPFEGKMNNTPAYIDFNKSFSAKSKKECEEKRLGYKLNAPYIHQLRQRFVSYLGRYGTPDIPESLRCFYLNHLVELTSNQNTC